MKYEIEVKDYDRSIRLTWEPEFMISVEQSEYGETVIRANRDGLISLANHLLTLAQEGVPSGAHIHLDAPNSLEDGSSELILTRWEKWEEK